MKIKKEIEKLNEDSLAQNVLAVKQVKKEKERRGSLLSQTQDQRKTLSKFIKANVQQEMI